MKKLASKGAIDQDKLRSLSRTDLEDDQDEVERQYRDLKDLKDAGDDDMETVQEDDSDAEEMQRIIQENKVYSDSEEEDEDENEDDEEMEDMEEIEEEEDEEEDEDMNSGSSDEEEAAGAKMGASGKQTLKARIKEEQEIRKKEKNMRNNTDQPKNIDDFERLVVSNTDQSFVWIQYIAFMLDNLGVDAARRIAERAVKSVSISNEEDKLNIWVAYMNLENNFGDQKTLEAVTKRALEVNDRQQVYL
jgi:rRNA biogenesis protein RRP5